MSLKATSSSKKLKGTKQKDAFALTSSGSQVELGLHALSYGEEWEDNSINRVGAMEKNGKTTPLIE